jgi:microcompartment protein CcmL/EutN
VAAPPEKRFPIDNYMVLLAGYTAAVESAVQAGSAAANGCTIDTLIIPSVPPDVCREIV